MDNNLEILGNVQQDQKVDQPVFKTQNDALNDSDILRQDNLNINGYLNRDTDYTIDKKAISKNGFIDKRSLEERRNAVMRRNNAMLQTAVKSMLKPLEADNVKISGKTAMERIMDGPPIIRFRSFSEKRQEDRRAAALQQEYKRMHPTARKVPTFDNATHKFRKNAIRYNNLINDEYATAYKKDLEKYFDWDDVKHFIPMYDVKPNLDPNAKQEKITNKRMFANTQDDKDERAYFINCMTGDDETRDIQIKKIIEKTLAFEFRAGMAKEDYMKTHYTELKRAIDQSLHLKGLLENMADGRLSHWDSLSDDVKHLIEMKMNTARQFKRLFDMYGVKHHVNTETGALLGNQSGYDAGVFMTYKQDYKNNLENNLATLKDIARKNRYVQILDNSDVTKDGKYK